MLVLYWLVLVPCYIVLHSVMSRSGVRDTCPITLELHSQSLGLGLHAESEPSLASPTPH